MPARIICRIRGGQEQALPIEREVSRFGAGEQCHLRVAGVPDFAFTLQFRSGQYRVVRRCEESVFIGAELLPIDTPVIWAEGATVRLNDVATLDLEVASDPSPATSSDTIASPFPELDLESAPDELDAALDSASSTKASGDEKPLDIMPLLVIAFCGIGFMFMAAVKFSGNGPSGGGERYKSASEINLLDLMDELKSHPESSLLGQIREQLRVAAAAERREDLADSNRIYREIQKRLLSTIPRDKDGKPRVNHPIGAESAGPSPWVPRVDLLFENELPGKVYEYVRYREIEGQG